VRSHWSSFGILLAVFLIVDGLLGWLFGLEFSDPVGHQFLWPYGQIALIAGPVLLISGGVIFFVSCYYRARGEPAGKLLSGYWWSSFGMLFGLFLFLDGSLGWPFGLEFSDPSRHQYLWLYGQIALIAGPLLLLSGVVIFAVSFYYRRGSMPVPPPATPSKTLVELRKPTETKPRKSRWKRRRPNETKNRE
jgi:hypothetical protein